VKALHIAKHADSQPAATEVERDHDVMSADTFLYAVSALYGSSGESRQDADRWLSDFKRNPQAWQVLASILQRECSAEALFVAADIMVFRARSDWKKMSSAQCEHILACVRCESSPLQPMTKRSPSAQFSGGSVCAYAAAAAFAARCSCAHCNSPRSPLQSKLQGCALRGIACTHGY
jgi:hypothetical protein